MARKSGAFESKRLQYISSGLFAGVILLVTSAFAFAIYKDFLSPVKNHFYKIREFSIKLNEAVINDINSSRLEMVGTTYNSPIKINLIISNHSAPSPFTGLRLDQYADRLELKNSNEDHQLKSIAIVNSEKSKTNLTLLIKFKTDTLVLDDINYIQRNRGDHFIIKQGAGSGDHQLHLVSLQSPGAYLETSTSNDDPTIKYKRVSEITAYRLQNIDDRFSPNLKREDTWDGGVFEIDTGEYVLILRIKNVKINIDSENYSINANYIERLTNSSETPYSIQSTSEVGKGRITSDFCKFILRFESMINNAPRLGHIEADGHSCDQGSLGLFSAGSNDSNWTTRFYLMLLQSNTQWESISGEYGIDVYSNGFSKDIEASSAALFNLKKNASLIFDPRPIADEWVRGIRSYIYVYIAIILILATSWFSYKKYVLDRIMLLNSAIRGFKENGDTTGFRKRLFGSNDEIGNVSETLHEFLFRNKAQNKKIIEKNTQLVTTQNSLSVQIEALEIILNLLGHNVNSPLQALESMAEKSSSMWPHLSRIRRLSNQIKNFEKIHKESFPRYPIEINKFLEEVVEFHSPGFNQCGKSLVYFERHSNASALGSPEALETIIDTILDNALDFCSKETQIHLEKSGKAIIISIENDGPKIPDEDIKNIFSYNYSTRSGRKDHEGKGLWITRYLVIKMNGEIKAENLAKGVAFKITLQTKGGAELGDN